MWQGRPQHAYHALLKPTCLNDVPPSHLCVQGIKNVPNRLRIVVQRKRNEDDEDSVSAVQALLQQPAAAG